MKICLINNLYKPYAKGGAEVVVEQTVLGLRLAGHSVVVITTHSDKEASFSEENSVKIYRFRPLNLFYYSDASKHNFISRLIWQIFNLFNFKAAKVVEEILKSEKPDLVITHNLMGVSFLLPGLIRKLEIRHFHVLHDVQLAVPSGLIIKRKENSLLARGPFAAIYTSICRRLFASPDVIVSPSRWLLQFYEKKLFFPSSHKVIIRNPVDVKIRKEGRRLKSKSFLFVGQLEKHKGVDWLVDHWMENKVSQQLHIVGQGSLKTTDLNEKNIHLHGRLVGAELNKIFAQVDYLIVPSLCYENSPTVIPLAYAHGVPVIVANIGGAGELVEENRTGWLFQAGDKGSFKNILSEVLDVSNLEYMKISRRCLEKAGEYDIEVYIRKILSM